MLETYKNRRQATSVSRFYLASSMECETKQTVKPEAGSTDIARVTGWISVRSFNVLVLCIGTDDL